MTDNGFEIVTDFERDLLRITLRGHWDTSIVMRYKAALLKAVGEMHAAGCVHGNLIALVDVREAGAQSQVVIEEYRKHLDDDKLHPRRLATILSSSLLKLQVRRVSIPNQRIFSEEEEALTWLLSTGEAS